MNSMNFLCFHELILSGLWKLLWTDQWVHGIELYKYDMAGVCDQFYHKTLSIPDIDIAVLNTVKSYGRDPENVVHNRGILKKNF
jgi:hypothetical protein